MSAYRRLLRTSVASVCAWVVVLLAIVLVAAPASAHSSLVRSDPPPGGTVAVGRSEVSLWFGEPIDSTNSSFRLLTDAGTFLPVTVSMPTGPIGEFVQLETPTLQRGILRLEWRAVSAEDGHTSSGTLTFGAGIRPPSESGSAGSPPAATEVFLRWVQLVTSMLAVGGLLASGLLRRSRALVPTATRQSLRLGSIATLAALLATLLAPLATGERGSNLLGGASSARWVQLWVVHVVALVAAVAIYSALARRGPSTLRLALAGSCLAVAAAADAAAGHAAELSSEPALAVGVTTLHVLAAGAWVGTLAILSACLVPVMRRSPDLRRLLLVTTWRAFSPIAAVSVGLLTASGMYLAGRQLPGLSALTSTWYGLAATGKALLLAATLVVAAGTAMIADPRLGRLAQRRTGTSLRIPGAERFPRRVGAELALLGTAVVLAAVMTSVPRPLTGGTPSTAPVSTTTDGLYVSFESVPIGDSRNRLIVRVSAVTRPQPGPVTGVDVMVEDPGRPSTSASLTEIEAGRFETTTPAPSPGRLRVWVSVHRAAVQDAVAGLDWAGTSASTSRRTGLEPFTTPLAGLVGAASLVGLVRLLRSRRRAGSGLTPETDPRERVVVGADGARHDG